MNQIKELIKELSNYNVNENTNNIYKGLDNETSIRRNNLELYLYELQKTKPKLILVGEASGYKGCGKTGIPFTSEKIINDNIFFNSNNFKTINNESEISSTIIWNELNKFIGLPLIFPYYVIILCSEHLSLNYESKEMQYNSTSSKFW